MPAQLYQLYNSNWSMCKQLWRPWYFFSVNCWPTPIHIYHGSIRLCLNHLWVCVINIQNYWIFRLCPSSGISNTRKHNVSETGSLSVLKREGRHLSLNDKICLMRVAAWDAIFATVVIPEGFVDSVINSKDNRLPNYGENPLGSVYIP
jgi:hypothetical protein